MLAAALLAAAAIVLVTNGQDLLPQLFSNSKDLNCINFSRANGVLSRSCILVARWPCFALASRCWIHGFWSHCPAGSPVRC